VTNLEGLWVVDTNVILKLFFDEDDTDRATALFQRLETGEIRIAVPDLLVAEFINVLWVKLRQGQADSQSSRTILAQFLDLISRLEVVSFSALAFETLEASIRYSHAAYDMAFLVLAEKLKAHFVTADVILFRKLILHSTAPVLLKALRLT